MCPSPPHNLVYVKCVDPSVLAFSLSLHRHPYICIPFSSRFIHYNKYTKTLRGKSACRSRAENMQTVVKPSQENITLKRGGRTSAGNQAQGQGTRRIQGVRQSCKRQLWQATLTSTSSLEQALHQMANTTLLSIDLADLHRLFKMHKKLVQKLKMKQKVVFPSDASPVKTVNVCGRG